MDGKQTLRLRGVLVVFILIVLWFVWGDQVIYVGGRSLATNTCPDFSATVVLAKEYDQDRTIYLNGVLINKSTIVTAKHGLVDTDFQIYANKRLYSGYILKVTDDLSSDLSYITIREIPGMIPAVVSKKMTGPFGLVTARNYLNTWVYPGINWKIVSELLVFPNKATEPGDSGAPLLNGDCEVVAIVHGGSHSFWWNLRPTSEYTMP